MPELPARDRAHDPRLRRARPPRGALALTLLLLALGCAHGPRGRGGGEGGDLRPPLNLPSVGPVPFHPAALSGRVVLVHFFATWCFPCLQEVPALRALQERYGPRGLTVVGVGMDLDGGRTLAPFARTFELPYPVLVADDALRAGSTGYGRIHELPSTVLLDTEGRAVAGWTGLAPPERVAELVEAHLPRP